MTHRAVDLAGNVGGIASAAIGTEAGDPTLAVSGDLVAGGVLTVSGTGWPADTDGRLELRSTPVDLGAVRTDAAGAFRVAVTLPADVTAGRHELVALIGDERVSVPLEIRAAGPGVTTPPASVPAAPNAGPSLAVTGGALSLGAVVLGLLAVGLGLALRRRRRVSEN